MRYIAAALVLSALTFGSAVAQDSTTASPGTNTATGSSNQAVNPPGNAPSDVNASGTSTIVAPTALEKGANSFTEGQVRKRVEGAGFTSVTGLKKDNDGIWRGQATKDGKSVSIGFDYKGNMSAQ